tara:strand:+ start:6324 stop:8447 length:2124 start_codon:yes stop_codon:yes gene_type:complete
VNYSRDPGAHLLPLDAHKGIVGLDIETTSAADLKQYGAWAYSQHPSTKVYVVSWAYAESPVAMRTVQRWYPGDVLPLELLEYIRAGGRLLAHNAGFEIAIWLNILLLRHDFPAFDLGQWRDTQALGNVVNLPQALDGLAKALGTKVKKDTAGKKLMLELAVASEPVPGVYLYPPITGAKLDRLSDYCDDDVLAMLHAFFKLQPLSPFEDRLWRLDQRVNLRGVYLDAPYAKRLQDMAERRSRQLACEAHRDSGQELEDSVAPPALKKWLIAKGVELPMVMRKGKDGKFKKTASADKRSIGEILARQDLDKAVRAVLENRLEATKATSLRKLRRVPLMAGADGRLRNALQYAAANTLRWTSSGLQIHNLPKDKLEDLSGLVDLAVANDDIEFLKLVTDRPLAALSQKLRSVIAAAPGHDLIAGDFSSVEACVLAWLAGQEDKLDFLHTYFRELGRFNRGEILTKPQDVYEFCAESIGSDSRQLGKVAELALGYQMGGIKFADTATAWGVPLAPVQASRVQRAWRATNKQIVDFWDECQDAAHAAVKEPGTSHTVGRVRFVVERDALRIKLPGGGEIFYWRPSLVMKSKTVKFYDKEDNLVEKEFEGLTLQFWTQSDSKDDMVLTDTYGGKLVENITQRVARDLLGEAMLRLDALDYPIVMDVHDSIAAEVLAGTRDVREFCEVMASPPRWATTCPINVDGYRAKRFRG